MRAIRTLILGGFATLAFGCAATQEQQQPKTLEEQLADLSYLRADEVDHIQNYRIDGWNFVDTRHVILHVPPSRRYLLTLSIPCSALIGQSEIGFTSTNSQLTKLDKLVVEEPGSSVPRSCPIERIDRLDRISS